MKKQSLSTFIIVGIIIILATILIHSKDTQKSAYTSDQVAQETSMMIDDNELIAPERFCYQYKQAIETNDSLLESQQDNYNIENVTFILTEGIVNGTHDIVPLMSDGNRAHFFGANNGQYINAVATATAEGVTWQEQRVYKYDEERLYVGYQPAYVPRIENEEGIYMYENIDDLVYDTEEFFLSRIDCDDLAL